MYEIDAAVSISVQMGNSCIVQFYSLSCVLQITISYYLFVRYFTILKAKTIGGRNV